MFRNGCLKDYNELVLLDTRILFHHLKSGRVRAFNLHDVCKGFHQSFNDSLTVSTTCLSFMKRKVGIALMLYFCATG